MEDKQYQMLLSTIHINLFAKEYLANIPSWKNSIILRTHSRVNDLIMYRFEDKDPQLVIPKKLEHQTLLTSDMANQGATLVLADA